MTELVLKIEREGDLEALLPLLNRLNIKYVRLNTPRKSTKKEIESAIKIVQSGADFSYLGDAAAWQREQRKDRELPFTQSAEL